MKGVAFVFLCTAALAVTCGMSWGIFMAVTGDHELAGAHAHLNLVGWVTMALFGFYYHLNQDAAGRMLAKVHYVVALAGLLAFVPGVVQAIRQNGETLVAIGAVLTLSSMLIFLFTVVTGRRRAG